MKDAALMTFKDWVGADLINLIIRELNTPSGQIGPLSAAYSRGAQAA